MDLNIANQNKAWKQAAKIIPQTQKQSRLQQENYLYFQSCFHQTFRLESLYEIFWYKMKGNN